MTEFRFTGGLFKPAGNVSRYRNHRIIEVDGVLSLETWKPSELPNDDEDFYLRLNPLMKWRLDLLADRYYGNQHLWFVIAQANNIIDPFMELNNPAAPVTLRIPAPKTVRTRVNS